MKPERLKALSRNFIQVRPMSLFYCDAHLMPVPAVMTCLGLKRDSSD